MTGQTKRILSLSGIFLIVLTLPYVYAALAGGEDFVFGGFLFNPLDGNSYLAKMYQGWRGDWLFNLPYTAEPGEGVFLFVFYLGLGHLARLLGLSLPVAFHLARLAGAVCLLIVLYHFYRAELGQAGNFAFILALFGAGLGWLATFLGLFTADFWVAEAYPFLSAYANPHFPIALAMMLAMLTDASTEKRLSGWSRLLIFGSGGFLLALILPFGIILVLLILAGLYFWQATDQLSQGAGFQAFYPLPEPARRGLALALGGLPVLIYYLWVVTTHTQLAVWNVQNLTLSPPWWDVLLSFSPALIFALLGAWFAWRERDLKLRVSIVWLVIGLVMLVLPVGLQRRFLLGYYVPLVALAAFAVEKISIENPRRKWVLTTALILISIPTNILILFTALFGVQTHEDQIYLRRNEQQGLAWIQDYTDPDALILAAPESGLFIPAHTGRRVLYGHPFETVEAERREKEVEAFFKGELTLEDLDATPPVDFIFRGPRETVLGNVPVQQNWSVAWETEGLTIYRVHR